MMKPPLSARDLLRLWEQADSQGSNQIRPLLILDIAYPESGWGALSRMSVGRRDRRLLALRERQLGQKLQLLGKCPGCSQAVELEFWTGDLAALDPNLGENDQDQTLRYRMEWGDMVVDFRLPNSFDLDAASRCTDTDAARQVLLDRCVRCNSKDGESDFGSTLPGEVQEALEEEMERLDPLAVIQVKLDCPACSHAWQARIDIADIVWTELATQSRRLLHEVSTLARHYHWSEESILEMTARRRDAYLELVST